jgi:hypothetical protein
MSIILLTTTVNVQSKTYLKQTDPIERMEYYTKSLYQWLTLTNFPIIVVENTGYTFDEWNLWKEQYKQRLEIISFKECDLDNANYLRDNVSKGASEIFAIEYAYLHSKIMREYTFLIKITGRFFIPDLESFLSQRNLDHYIALNQQDIEECQMVGVHLNYFYLVFYPVLLNKNGIYEPHVEYIYKERILGISPDKMIRCPSFPIEPTFGGGSFRRFTHI